MTTKAELHLEELSSTVASLGDEFNAIRCDNRRRREFVPLDPRFGYPMVRRDRIVSVGLDIGLAKQSNGARATAFRVIVQIDQQEKPFATTGWMMQPEAIVKLNEEMKRLGLPVDQTGGAS